MQVKVIHTAFEDTPIHVATVTTPPGDHEMSLEYAYRWTQNIMDSWSKKGAQDGNDWVEVVAPLHLVDGETWGLRSTSMNDEMIIEGTTYLVGAVGFEQKEVDFA